jgi:rhodanese-related sulfurtransferase
VLTGKLWPEGTVSSVKNLNGYAGDVSPAQAWKHLEQDPKAQLVDVRTTAEWLFVGTADVSSLGRELHRVEWQQFPRMSPNPEFVRNVSERLKSSGADVETPVFFVCRSGARSRAAAIAMTAAGFHRAFNVEGGFEGDMDAAGHRGMSNGWKAAGLPWRQS